MNAALVRVWLYPETSEILAVPPTHVVKDVFLHEQPSNLAIVQDGKRVGGITLRPRRDDANGLRIVEFAGSMSLKLPFLSQQPFSWHGSAEMNRTFALRQLKVHLETHGTAAGSKAHAVAASSDAIDLDVDPQHKIATYHVSHDQKPVMESAITLDEKGARSALEMLGPDPALASQIDAGVMSLASQFTVAARQSEIQIHGERVAVFHVTLNQGTTPMMEADISQLGQVLFIKTALGFTLSPDDITP